MKKIYNQRKKVNNTKDAQLDLFYFIDDNYKNDFTKFITDFKNNKFPKTIEDFIKRFYTNIMDLIDDYLDFQIEL